MNRAQNKINQWITNNNINEPLNLNFLNLPVLPLLPDNLQKLNCGRNQLTTLPTLPPNLVELNCGRNQLTTLPTLPPNLQKLNCDTNQLTTLPILPPNLQKLDCDTNQLTILPTLPNNLKNLYCGRNQLTTLPTLPNNLIELHCNENVLTTLPTLPPNLVELNCNDNVLTTLPTLPNNLVELECGNNQLTTLPNLPDNLQRLFCYNNQLTNLPILPNNLQVLSIDNINLLNPTQIQFLNNNDVEVYIDNRRINLIPHLPEPTQEELNNHSILGQNIYNQVTSNQQLRNANIIDNLPQNVDDDIPLYLNELDSKTQDIYKRKCDNNKEDLLGDTLNVKYGNIVILDISNPDKYVAWCFTYPEALEMWQYSKTYNMMYGYPINRRGVLLSRIYNTFVLRDTNSRTRGGITIYTLDPIPQNAFVNEIRITPQIINNFVPTINDLNLYYLNNPYTQPNNNNVIINNDSIIGNLGEITLNNPIRNVVRIIKDNIVGDINKSYEIVGDNVVLIQNVIVGDNVELIQDELLGEY
jgi:Leucine-rich repeat (LRR) protein